MISSTLPKKKFRLPEVEPRQHFEITRRSTINKHKKAQRNCLGRGQPCRHQVLASLYLLGFFASPCRLQIPVSHANFMSRLVHIDLASRLIHVGFKCWLVYTYSTSRSVHDDFKSRPAMPISGLNQSILTRPLDQSMSALSPDQSC
ncbi:hypothetical protein BHE74_00057092 [Ensete ventricosum]|nr:hypothetical protein BHE74_00057092 [Ensete ventricosum]